MESSDINVSSSSEEENLSSTTCTSDAETPSPIPKKKRRYKSAILHGLSSRRANYYKVTPEKYQGVVKLSSLSQVPVDECTSSSDSDANIRSINDSLHVEFSEPDAHTDAIRAEFTELEGSHTTSDDYTETQPLDDSSDNMSESDDESVTSNSTSSSDNETMEQNKMFDAKEFDDTKELLYDGCRHSKFAAYSLIMLFVTKHGLSRDGFTELLELISTLLPDSASFTTSVYKVKEALKTCIKFEDPIVHKYCEVCQRLLPDGNRCENETCIRNAAKTLEFLDLNLIDQLSKMFLDEYFVKLITRQTDLTNHQDISEITHGNRYKEVIESSRNADVNLTFSMNTDGVALFSSSKKGSLWPVYLAINELPIKLRFSRKYLIPCYLHCQVEKPNMLSYLSPLMKTLQTLSKTGIQVQTPTGSLVVKGHLLIASLDLPARALVSNMKQFNGKSSCSICKDEGESPAGNPMLRFFQFEQNSELRTHQSWVDDARKASNQGKAVNGIKGVSALMMLPYIDLPKVFAVDWMHCILLGVTKALMKFWFDNKYKDKDFFIGNKMELLDKRYLSIKIPDFVSRRQRTLVDHNHWKASECREWLIHFSVPVLHGILGSTPYAHYLLLVTGISTLIRDDLKSDDVNYAENLLADFCKVFPEIYGTERQTMNLHLVRHLADTVRMYGPLYCYSCFGFESMNSFLKDMVHGTRHINKQIGFAVGMSKQLTSIVRKFTEDNVDPKTKQLFVKLGSKFIQEEKPEDNSTRGLGRKIAAKDTYRYIHLITEEMKEKQPKTLGRVKRLGTIYKSEGYQHAKTRCDFVTSYYEGNVLRFGIILSFIEVEEQIFAVMKKCEVVPFMLNPRLMQTVTDPILKENFQKVLCGHISKIVSYGETVLIPSTKLRKKCILMKVTANLEFISVPPNILEHN